MIYRDFLPDALAEGRYVAAPKPSVLGHGVQDFQQAMDIQRKGVSAAKVVVTRPVATWPNGRWTSTSPAKHTQALATGHRPVDRERGLRHGPSLTGGCTAR